MAYSDPRPAKRQRLFQTPEVDTATSAFQPGLNTSNYSYYQFTSAHSEPLSGPTEIPTAGELNEIVCFGMVSARSLFFGVLL